MRNKAYSAVIVNEVVLANFLSGREGQDLIVGQDIGKEFIFAVLYWSKDDVARPWKIANPTDLKHYVGLLKQLAVGRTLRVAMEPTGTYGDPLRQALADAGIALQRVSTKATHDYAEIYDGVPSQHDGKDAAVVAELVALGKSREWPWRGEDSVGSEMRYWVGRLESALKQQQIWTSQLEGQVMRHWPELARELKLTSWTLLRILSEYGDPRLLTESAAAALAAADRLRRWSFGRLTRERIAGILASARQSAGVRMDGWSRRQLRGDARRALQAKRRVVRASRELCRLAKGHEVLKAQAEVVGGATACVLWVHLGDPRDYAHAGMYRKAMGLNLRERSSGRYQGELKITKRGHAAVRRWLYFSALRLIRSEPARSWFRSKQDEKKRGTGKKAVVAVMRKLALGLHRVGISGDAFAAKQLFSEEPMKAVQQSARQAARSRKRRRKRGRGGRAREETQAAPGTQTSTSTSVPTSVPTSASNDERKAG